MTSTIVPSTGALRLRRSGRLSQPLFRNGHALALSSVLTAGIGFVFWLLAARRYSTAVVGQDAVVISTLQTIGSIAQLNLANGMIRFMPGAGMMRRRFVLRSYAASAVVALVLSVAFLAVVPLLSPSLDFLVRDPLIAGTWILTTIAWSIFVLEDGALTGLRRATWVPIENAGFAIVKAALVIPLAALSVRTGIFVAWSIATLLTVVPTNVLLLLRAAPREQLRAPEGTVTIGQLAHYVPFDYLASLCWFGTVGLLPLLIIHRIGASANAFFSLAWVVAYTFFLVSINLGSSLIVESIADPADLRERCRDLAMHLAKLLVPTGVVVIVTAPFLLRLFGAPYAAASVTTMRLLVLSSFPFILTSTVMSGLRVMRRTGLVFLADACLAVIVTAMTWALLPRLGIESTGVAWLVGQSVCAAGVYVLALRVGLSGRRALGAVALSAPAAPHANRARPVAPPGSSDDVPLANGAAAVPSEVRERLGDVLVLDAGAPRGRAQEVVIVPRSTEARDDLLRQQRVLEVLRADVRLGPLRDLLPPCRVEHDSAIGPFALRTVVGRPAAARAFVAGPVLPLPAASRGLEFALELHDRTSRRTRLDDPQLAALVSSEFEPLRRFHPSGRVPQRQLALLERIELDLLGAFSGREVELGWVHGDFVPVNVVLSADERDIETVVGWDQARPDGLGLVDILAWSCSIEAATRAVDLGTLLASLISKGEFPDLDPFAHAREELDRLGVEPRVALLAFWISSIAGNLRRGTAGVRNPLWWVRNVESVLVAVAP